MRPTFPRVTQIQLHSTGDVVVVGKEPAEVLENLDPLDLLSVHGELRYVGSSHIRTLIK